MAYRDDIEVLRRRIEELELDIDERIKERDRLNSLINLGPKAYGLYSRLMYRLGRGLGRGLLWRLPRGHARATEAARQRVRLLERRLARVEEELVQARAEAAKAGFQEAERAISEKNKKSRGRTTL